MASDTRIANNIAIVMCDALVDRVDNGTAGTGKLEIRTGVPPTDVETAPTGTLLSTINFSNPAFGGATDQNPGARASVSGSPADTSATAAGTAGYYRVYDRQTTPVGVWQNTAGGAASGEGMELSNANIAAGQQITITAMTMDVPET